MTANCRQQTVGKLKDPRQVSLIHLQRGPYGLVSRNKFHLLLQTGGCSLEGQMRNPQSQPTGVCQHAWNATIKFHNDLHLIAQRATQGKHEEKESREIIQT